MFLATAWVEGGQEAMVPNDLDTIERSIMVLQQHELGPTQSSHASYIAAHKCPRAVSVPPTS